MKRLTRNNIDILISEVINSIVYVRALVHLNFVALWNRRFY